MRVIRLVGACALAACLLAVASPAGYAGLLPPVSTTLPSIAGSAQDGQTVTCNPGTWLNSPTSYAYSWQRDVTTAIGGSANTYTLTAADVGHAITCTVVASNSSGSGTPAVSAPIVPASLPVAAVPVEESLPSISGSPQQDQSVTCAPGTWLNSPSSYAYTWQRDAATAIGGTANTYTLTGADVGHAITCTVVAWNSSGSSAPAVSAPIVPSAPPIAAVPLELSPPVISGTATPGKTVTCSAGSWANDPTGYSYSWQSDGLSLPGQTTDQYAITSGDVNHALTCTVVAGNAAGASAPAISPPVVPLELPLGLVPVETAPPVISGSAVEGHTVACSPGTWLNNPTDYAYGWERNAVAIAGQAAGQYTLTRADVGQAITCTVVAHNSSGDSLPAISAPVIPALGSIAGGGPGIGGSGRPSGGTTGGGTGGAAGRHPPTLRSFWAAPGKVIVTVRGRRRTTKGTTFHYSLNERAGLLIELKRRLPGRLHGRSCVPAIRQNRRAKPCARWVTVKVLQVKSAKPGSGRLKFAGRIGGHLLAIGAYRAYAAAVSTGGWSKVRSTKLMVVAKPVARRPGRQKPDR